MPYRGRAVKKISGQRKLKKATPSARFTLTKVYNVSKGQAAAGNNAYVLDIDVSTPFNPISARNGDWSANDNFNEPFGLNSDLYSHYNHLVVKGCRVTASVRDNPDQVPSEDELITMGQLSMIRADQANAINGTATASSIKSLYGHSTRGFQLSPRNIAAGVSNNILTKNAYCKMGYSARKTWKANPLSVDSLRVTNSSGGNHTASDTTHINVVVLPQNDNTGSFLQPMQVVVKLDYIITFVEPTRIQSVPLPMGTYSKGESWYEYGKKMYNQYGKTVATQAAKIAYAAAKAHNRRQNPRLNR